MYKNSEGYPDQTQGDAINGVTDERNGSEPWNVNTGTVVGRKL